MSLPHRLLFDVACRGLKSRPHTDLEISTSSSLQAECDASG